MSQPTTNPSWTVRDARLLNEARAHVDNCRKNTRLAMAESDAAERSRDELIALAAQAETYANDKAAAYEAAAQAEANACYELARLQAPKPAPPAVEAATYTVEIPGGKGLDGIDYGYVVIPGNLSHYTARLAARSVYMARGWSATRAFELACGCSISQE